MGAASAAEAVVWCVLCGACLAAAAGLSLLAAASAALAGRHNALKVVRPARPPRRAGRVMAEHALARRMLRAVSGGRDVRGAKVRAVREAILAGDYENDLKRDVAARRLLVELGVA